MRCSKACTFSISGDRHHLVSSIITESCRSHTMLISSSLSILPVHQVLGFGLVGSRHILTTSGPVVARLPSLSFLHHSRCLWLFHDCPVSAQVGTGQQALLHGGVGFNRCCGSRRSRRLRYGHSSHMLATSPVCVDDSLDLCTMRARACPFLCMTLHIGTCVHFLIGAD